MAQTLKEPGAAPHAVNAVNNGILKIASGSVDRLKGAGLK
jgi:hypothetical protein